MNRENGIDLSMLFIETDRLHLRPFKREDLAGSIKMNNDPEVSRYTADGGVVSEAEVARRIREDVLGDYMKFGFGRQAVVLKETNEFIGFCGLKYLFDMHKVDLGYRFMQEFWGKGYATEAARACVKMGFERLELPEMIASLLPENKASIRVLEKLHFEFTEVRKEDDLDVHYYRLSRENYLKHYGS